MFYARYIPCVTFLWKTRKSFCNLFFISYVEILCLTKHKKKNYHRYSIISYNSLCFGPLYLTTKSLMRITHQKNCQPRIACRNFTKYINKLRFIVFQTIFLISISLSPKAKRKLYHEGQLKWRIDDNFCGVSLLHQCFTQEIYLV